MLLSRKTPSLLFPLIVFILLLIGTNPALAVQEPGAGPQYNIPEINFTGPVENPSLDIPNGHVSLIFTVGDVIFFSYSDGTLFELYDSSNTLIFDNGGLPVNKGEYAVVTGISGTFKAVGSQTFAVLSGDPITNSVCGYFAMDDGGFGTGTEFFTWVPLLFDHAEFVVFGYHANTEVTVSYTDTGVVIDTFILNDGEHWNMSTLTASMLHVEASQPVSVLTAYDQGYYVPADDGLWSGQKFHTYISDTGGWGADMTVISYEDNTNVEIINSDTLAPVWSGVLNSGEVHVETFPGGSGEYFTVTTDKTCSLNCQPWVVWIADYHQGAYIPDRTGSGVGTNFIGPSMNGGILQVLAYQDNTTIDVFDAATDVMVGNATLNAGQSQDVNPGNGMWRIRSDKIVSVWSGWGTFSADFAPVEFAQSINPLNLNKTDGLPEGYCLLNGEQFDYTICFDNGENDIEVTQVVLVDDLPGEFIFVAASDGGVYDPVGHTVTWDIGTLAPGDPGACFTVTVVVGEELDFEFVNNVATITSAETGSQSVTEVSQICAAVGVYMPSPQIVSQNGGFTLNWQSDDGQVDGYNIYRRTLDSEALRVNSTLVPYQDGQVSFIDRPEVPVGTTLLYSYAKVSDGQEMARSGETEVVWNGSTPSATYLVGNFPNPFNPQTTIKFNLGRSGQARLSIYDVSGHLVKVLHDGPLASGAHERVWMGVDDKGRSVPSGIYYYRLESADRVWMDKMSLIK